MKKPIDIKKQSVVKDEIGNEIKTWTQFLRVFAEINGQNGKEYVAAGSEISKEIFTFKTRYVESLSKKTPEEIKIEFEDEEYDVSYIDDYKNLHKSLTITAVRKR